MTPEDAAKVLHVTPRTVRYWITCTRGSFGRQRGSGSHRTPKAVVAGSRSGASVPCGSQKKAPFFGGGF
ncbi:MAG: helix-turn-helix domain-containing protein [Thiobacillus sp.]|nr:helix-turn-helix domain-containing protein [Thiobacillus sp.]